MKKRFLPGDLCYVHSDFRDDVYVWDSLLRDTEPRSVRPGSMCLVLGSSEVNPSNMTRYVRVMTGDAIGFVSYIYLRGC